MSDRKLPYAAVLMCGGIGTRLWPLSRSDYPKQVLPLIRGRSLLELTLERIQPVFPPGNIFFSTNAIIAEIIRKRFRDLSDDRFFCEPAPRNTAPALAYALASLKARYGQCVMACLPSDHFIGNTSLFLQVLNSAYTLASKGYLVTIGIPPHAPLTGYGYVEQGEALTEAVSFPAYRVKRFKEKPSQEEAQRLLESGNHVWNSGMFFWRTDVLEAEFLRQKPEMLEKVNKIIGESLVGQALTAAWDQLESISIDYGILENAQQVAILPADQLCWTDIGSWDALMDLYNDHPEFAPGSDTKQIQVDGSGVTVFQGGTHQKWIATIGLNDLVIVETDDALLICRKGQSQNVRKIIQALPDSL